jgi:hypothetical protein
MPGRQATPSMAQRHSLEAKTIKNRLFPSGLNFPIISLTFSDHFLHIGKN